MSMKGWEHLRIPFEKIEVATENFKTCIGKGGYGRVYKGVLLVNGNYTNVAVKRLNEQFGQGLKEFLTEIQLLSGEEHPNLISLVGYSDEGREKIIVYEYAERGSLDRYIRCDRDATSTSLTWLGRLKICADAAHGLDHLHNHVGGHATIIHRDIKSSNILIDENWVAKITDFGLSKLSGAGFGMSFIVTDGCGTLGYCEPEYENTGILTKKSDVYSFGIVLFEVLCGRLCRIVGDDDDGFRLTGKSAKEYFEKGNLDKIIDPTLEEHIGSYYLSKFATIAYRCLNNDREQRPGMDAVKNELEEMLKFQVEVDVEYERPRTEGNKVDILIDNCEQKLFKKHEVFSLQPLSRRASGSNVYYNEKGMKKWQHLKIQFRDIELATKKFQNLIGRGGFGMVYQGELSRQGKPIKVAAKRLDEKFGQGLKQFFTEIQLLSGQEHPNLVSLVGYCDEGKEKIIVYEYAERGSLDRYIVRIRDRYSWGKREQTNVSCITWNLDTR